MCCCINTRVCVDVTYMCTHAPTGTWQYVCAHDTRLHTQTAASGTWGSESHLTGTPAPLQPLGPTGDTRNAAAHGRGPAPRVPRALLTAAFGPDPSREPERPATVSLPQRTRPGTRGAGGLIRRQNEAVATGVSLCKWSTGDTLSRDPNGPWKSLFDLNCDFTVSGSRGDSPAGGHRVRWLPALGLD